ncbi:hypothetical protein GCM10017608_19100 [Agromyces luteolus]|nr:hypothetical protein GCM10017608_19100 [Agromyces luteolus]
MYRVEPHSTGTLLTCVMRMTTHGLTRVAEPILRVAIEREVRRSDPELVAILESESAAGLAPAS